MTHSFSVACGLSLLLSLCTPFCVATQSQDWNHWRGPSRNDLSDSESGFREGKWHLTESWTANHGIGSSSPVIFQNQMLTFSWVHGKETLTSSPLSNGQEITWAHSYKAPKYGRLATGDQGLFAGPSSTPEVDPTNNKAYTLGSDGHLTCWDLTKQGEIDWQISLYDEYEIPRRPKVGRSGLRDYGFTTSPLLLNNQLIVEVGSKRASLVAFDPKTGKELWESVSASPAGHTGGPVPIIVDKVPCVAAMTHEGLLVVRTDGKQAGQTVAKVDWLTEWANNIATPTVFQNKVVITSAYNQNRIAMYEITLKGAQLVWKVAHPSKICSPVIFNGHVYYCWRKIRCLDLKSGDLIWQGGNTGDAGSMVVTADKRIIVWSKKGDLSLINGAELSPDRLRILASRKVLTKTDAWPHVVVAANRIICKDWLGNMKCFEITPIDKSF